MKNKICVAIYHVIRLTVVWFNYEIFVGKVHAFHNKLKTELDESTNKTSKM